MAKAKKKAKKRPKKRKTREVNGSAVRYPPEVRQEAIRLAKLRRTVPEIANALAEDGHHPTTKTIREWLTAADVEAPSGRVRRRRYDRKQILRDLRAIKNGQPKYTRAQLQEKYGCSPKFLSQLASGELQP